MNDDWMQEEAGRALQRILQKARILLAVFLVMAVIFLDKSGRSVGSLNAQKIFSAIRLDYGQAVTGIVSQLLTESKGTIQNPE